MVARRAVRKRSRVDEKLMANPTLDFRGSWIKVGATGVLFFVGGVLGGPWSVKSEDQRRRLVRKTKMNGRLGKKTVGNSARAFPSWVRTRV